MANYSSEGMTEEEVLIENAKSLLAVKGGKEEMIEVHDRMAVLLNGSNHLIQAAFNVYMTRLRMAIDPPSPERNKEKQDG